MRQRYLLRIGQLQNIIPNVIPHGHIGIHHRPYVIKLRRLVDSQHTFLVFALLLVRQPLGSADDVPRIGSVAGLDLDADD